jgi:hypothetical protein
VDANELAIDITHCGHKRGQAHRTFECAGWMRAGRVVSQVNAANQVTDAACVEVDGSSRAQQRLSATPELLSALYTDLSIAGALGLWRWCGRLPRAFQHDSDGLAVLTRGAPPNRIMLAIGEHKAVGISTCGASATPFTASTAEAEL